MKKVSIAVVFLFTLLCANVYSGEVPTPVSPFAQPAVKVLDVNKDGNPDITYHSTDGKYVTKVEADTNYDGKSDITVHVKDGKFHSAEVDADYDGKAEKKFTDDKAFKEWLNKERPEFSDRLTEKDWTFTGLKF